MSILYILVGFALLVLGGEFLVRSSVALSFKFKLSKMMIGLTVVSFATSAPELLVSINAAMEGLSSIALGNVIGSNIANIGLVLGTTALIAPLAIDRDFYKFNWPVMMIFSILLFVVLTTDMEMARWEGLLMLVLLIIYLWMLLARARRTKNAEVDADVNDKLATASGLKITFWLLAGALSLWLGSESLVKGAVALATQMGVSERVIAVTMIAVGTSVPELAASIIAAVKKEKAISLGNLIGSNIFNIASVLGITALIQPIAVVDRQILDNDIFWMLGFAAILIPMAFLPKRFELGRLKGLLIVLGYIAFVSLAFLG